MAGAGSRRERKVVTVVFCDLVGFTQRAEKLDPEDVEAFLDPYHERLRAELERFGGTVEKFIGDAVMALFGAPVAHEDDPERAVRAALAIRDWALESDDLEVRLAVTTGEALVRLDARPETGEGMASGDVVNTAARLQAAAPVNGVLVDETTFRATRHVVYHDEAEPVEAKGKAAPIPVWRPRTARTRFGVDVAHEARVGLVGRERELGILRDAFARAVHERIPQLVTLVGVPGIGKSRLVYELRRIAQEDAELITWRQGRCLAYGDGVTLWALGEIVKAQAGILEQDSPAEVEEKVRETVAAVVAGDDARWVEENVLALVGLAEDAEVGGDRRGEAFAAWRRFLEALAQVRPLVLVFEDLHWADESLLDFVDELVDWVVDVPLLVVGTARPELLERRSNWGGGKLDATTLALSPLSDQQTARLIASLLDRPVLTAETQHALLERAGGNPLYAEQFSDLFRERGSTEELSLPETLHGIISARVDGLASAEKGLLHDAAVVGKVFWTGAVEHARDDAAVALHGLERKGFVRRQLRSSVEGETEFAFSHALVRDVAYGQIPRGDRAAKHEQTAQWIESLGRPEDHAEMLAYHWSSALELARASGGGGEAQRLSERARLALRAAGDRAFGLNTFGAAARYYADALKVWPEDGERPELVFKRARALFIDGDARALEELEAARDALVGAGRRQDAAEAEAFLAQLHWFRGEQDAVFPHLTAADELVAGTAPSRAVARVLAFSARYRMLAGNYEEGRTRAEEALAIAETLGLDDLRVHALTTIGSAKESLSDTTGRNDLERAVEIGRAANSPMVAGALNNLTVFLDTVDHGYVEELTRQAQEEAQRFGDVTLLRFLRPNSLAVFWIRGRWDEALELSQEVIAECERGVPNVLEGQTRLARACILLARGRNAEALADFATGLDIARRTPGDPQNMGPALVRNAWARVQLGRFAEARDLFAEAVPHIEKDPHSRPWLVAEVAYDLAQTAPIRAALAVLPPTPGRAAMFAVLDGRFEEAAEQYASAGLLLFEAEAHLRSAEQLVSVGRRDEGEEHLELALAFYRPLGATLFIERGERLLAEARTA